MNSTSVAQAKQTYHFDGKKFINPTLEKPFSPRIRDIIKIMRARSATWPQNVKNKATPQLHETLETGAMAITFINHATFLVQFPKLNILTDPVWYNRASPIKWLGPKRVRKPGVTLDSLPKIDLVLLSHNHYDHLDKLTLKALNQRFSPLVLVPLGDKKLIASLGIKNVRELDWWENVALDQNTTITFTPQQHSSARGLFDRDKSLWGSFFIRNERSSVFFGGDGGYSTHFKDIQGRLGSPDLAMLGIGAYMPGFFMKAIHTSPAEAVMAHQDLGARQSIGMHFGTFQLGSEGFDQPLADLKKAMETAGVPEERFVTMLEGETKLYRPKPEKQEQQNIH